MAVAKVNSKNITFYVAAMFLILAFAEFIPQMFTLRIAGQNVLNQRLWINIVVLSVIFTKFSALRTKSMVWLYLYFLVYIVFESYGHYDLRGFGAGDRYFWFRDQHLSIGISVLLAEYFIRQEKLSELKILVDLSVAIILIMCAYNIYLIFRNPGLVRGTGIKLDSGEVGNYRRIGLSSYVFFSSLPFLIPYLVHRYRINSKRGLWDLIKAIIAIALVLTCSYMAVIVAPFLLAVILLLVSIVGRRRFKSNIIIMFMLAITVTLLPGKFMSSFFYNLSDVVPNSDIRLKLNEIGQGYEYGFSLVSYDDEATTSIEGRASRIKYNLNDFAKSPFIGTGKESNGHIFWLNILAQFGLFGIIPLVMILNTQVLANIKREDYDLRFTYVLSIGGFVVLGFMKAVSGYAMFLIPFFVVPGALFLLSHNTNRLHEPLVD